MKLLQVIPELIVDDMDKMIEFFVERFDFKVEATDPEDGDYTWAQIVNGENRIMMQTTAVTKIEIPSLEKRVTGTDLLMLKFDSMETAKSYYSRFGAESIYMDIRVTEYGSCEFGVIDPEGRLIIVSGD